MVSELTILLSLWAGFAAATILHNIHTLHVVCRSHRWWEYLIGVLAGLFCTPVALSIKVRDGEQTDERR